VCALELIFLELHFFLNLRATPKTLSRDITVLELARADPEISNFLRSTIIIDCASVLSKYVLESNQSYNLGNGKVH